ncbi:TonB-dependent receptor domain-containing protein [Aurantiacibacter spongiae]|uniref:TonB-dependent receptor n=1 Tax=Aurantiacibacter spongiae TaxID=2488860 RepID=A0A3N5D8E3_9SPHN|nr:TonB-dependent receptor [Aurantiacibacter spongiae]RPF70878.1 TonB-dependent receptor [Aurantiacibacter spongiae]
MSGRSERTVRAGSALVHVLLAGAALAVPVGALAQAGRGAPPRDGAEDAPPKDIVVTGTLIRSGRRDAPVPIEVIDAADLARQGAPSLLELARQLPVSNGVLGDASQFDPRSQFNQGSASVNLRGLGPQRTLVLLNGRRMVATGAGNVPLVDINLFPANALDRIEILKDGAAATYGSDAIAGVVNVITRTDQDGLLVQGDYRLVAGSDGDWSAGVSYGAEIGPARVLLSAGYQRRGELRVTDRAFAMRPYPQNPQGGFSGGGNPGNFDFDAARGGISFDADEGCGALGGFRSLPGSTADLCLTSYLGFTNLVEPEDRFQLFGDVAFDLTARAVLRLTGLYGRTATVLNTSPSFLPTIAPSANAAFGGTGLFTIPAYAPALIDYCARFGEEAGCATGADGKPAAAALAYPVRFRPLLAGGNPLFDNDRNVAALDRNSDAYQIAAELTYEVGSDLTLTAGATYSEYDRFFEVGDSFVDYLQNALAGFGGPDCAFADPASRAGLTTDELARIAGTRGCTYFNPFSTGVDANRISGQANPNFAGNGSPAGLDTSPGAGLVNDPSTVGHFYNVWGRTANTRQWVADLVLTGGTGLVLPGGEVDFAIGGQFRRDSHVRTYEGGNNLDLYPCPGSVLDPQERCDPEPGALGFIGAGRDFAVDQDILALFAEVQLPVTQRLFAQLAARFEDYGGSVGSTFDPQVRVRYRATDWLTLRGGLGTTFRGPPPNQTAADTVILTFIGGAFRAVDLLANPDLAPESATTWNVGAVVDGGGLAASIDYWSYDLAGAIENEPVAGIVSALFGASGTANCGDPAYNALQARFTFSGGICGGGNVQRLRTFAVNSADLTTSGLDMAASYDWRIGTLDVQIGARGTYVLDYAVGDVVVEGVVVQPAFDAVGLLNYQTTAYPIPDWKAQLWVQLLAGNHALRLQANHVDDYADQRGDAVFGPNEGVLAGASVAAGRLVDSFTTLDLTWRWSPRRDTTVSLALANLLDADPPFARLDQNYDPFTANPLGLTAKFGISQAF